MSKDGKTRSNFATQSWRATDAVQPLHVMIRHNGGCVAGLHAIVARLSCSVSFRLNSGMVSSRDLERFRGNFNLWICVVFS